MNTIKGFILVFFLTLSGTAMGLQQQDGPDNPLAKDVFEAIETIDYISLNIHLADATPVDTINEEGQTPLMLAAGMGNPRILNIVLAHEPELDRKNRQGKTALMIAAENGLAPVVATLLRHGADTGLRDENGNTAISLASKYGHREAVTLLQNKTAKLPLAK